MPQNTTSFSFCFDFRILQVFFVHVGCSQRTDKHLHHVAVSAGAFCFCWVFILGLHTTNLPQREVDWYSRARQEKINITKPEEQRIKKEWRTKRALNPYRKKSRTSPAASSWKNTLYKTGHKEWHKVQQHQKETGVE